VRDLTGAIAAGRREDALDRRWVRRNEVQVPTHTVGQTERHVLPRGRIGSVRPAHVVAHVIRSVIARERHKVHGDLVRGHHWIIRVVRGGATIIVSILEAFRLKKLERPLGKERRQIKKGRRHITSARHFK